MNGGQKAALVRQMNAMLEDVMAAVACPNCETKAGDACEGLPRPAMHTERLQAHLRKDVKKRLRERSEWEAPIK